MEDALTATIEEEMVFDSVITKQPSKPIRRLVNITRSMNGNRPGLDESAQTVTIRTQVDEEADSQPDCYLGWRYVETTLENGEVDFIRVPLTEYDLLHPQEDDAIMTTTPHGRNTKYIDIAMSTHLTDEPQTVILNDVGVDLNLAGIEPVNPDIAIISGVPTDKDWSVFNCQEEGVVPSVAFEVTSPSTRKNDFGKKHDYYSQAGIPHYVVVDIAYDKNKQASGYTLFVYELIGRGYVSMRPDSQGRYWLPSIDAFVGIGEEGILCYDASGNLLLTDEELAKKLAETEQRLDEVSRRAEEQEQIARQEARRAEEQEQIARREAERAAEQERLLKLEVQRTAEQEEIARQEAERAAEQEEFARKEAARATEQERLLKLEAERVAEQGRLLKLEQERVAERERQIEQEMERAAEQEQIAQTEAQRAEEERQAKEAAEEENARLRALIEQLGGKV